MCGVEICRIVRAGVRWLRRVGKLEFGSSQVSTFILKKWLNSLSVQLLASSQFMISES